MNRRRFILSTGVGGAGVLAAACGPAGGAGTEAPKATAERVVFKEPTPVSRDEKIVVKLLTPHEKEVGSLANPKEVTREEDGKLVWRVNLKAGEKREFSLKVSVEHPGEIAVSGLY